MIIEAQGDQRLTTINRVKATRVIDLGQLAYEDLQLFCSAMPWRFLQTLDDVFKAETCHRSEAR